MFSIQTSSIKYLETPRGIAFSADLMEDGNKIATVHNNGNGGATYLDPTNGWNTDEYKRLEAEAEPFNGMEWYLESLMDKAEDLSNVFDLGE